MKLSNLETTPNPNSMKLNLDEQIVEKPLSLQRGKTLSNVPDKVFQLLDIEGVREVFLASNFITLTRHNNADWETILSRASGILGLAENADTEILNRSKDLSTSSLAETSKSLGLVEVAVLFFRCLPTQVKVIGAFEQARVNLPARFEQTLQRVIDATGANYVEERYWEPYPSRSGQPEEVAKMMVEEIASLIDEEELARLSERIITGSKTPTIIKEKAKPEDLLVLLGSSDWKTRLKAIQKLEINPQTFPALVQALEDPKATVRRWAAALLGSSERQEAIEPLSKLVLNDPIAVVRRTAGDALSDLGNVEAIPTMCLALEDSSSFVRWRAARFLNEVAESSSVEALQKALGDESEFDVRLEIEAALERVTSGGERQLPMWMRLNQTSEPLSD
ncbi:virulence factor [Hyella patelloides]|nr:virulence factor [Hyella patelloides]